MSAEYPAHLPRGKACVPCRRRKMKCDGNKPKCNQCLRFSRSEECEYNEVAVPSTARVLEQHIARLQSRIQELEQDDPSLVKLHNPYHRAPVASPPPAVQEWWQIPEPPPRVAQFLVNQFLPHAAKFGFFFQASRFVASMFNPTVSKPRPPTVLRNAVYLWGISLSRDRQYTAREALFLSRALSSIHAALSSAQPQDTLYVLQAEILLAYYFFHNSRLIEGKFHSGAAVSLVIMCGLHKQGGGSSAPTTDMSMSPLGFTLPPPRDALEEGERIHAWWTTFILDKCWVVALGSPSTITEDDNSSTRIDTPWPLELEAYGQQPRSRNSHTIRTFIQGLLTGSGKRDASFFATYAKAAALYERTTRYATLWEKDITSHQADFNELDACIERFKQTLPSPERVNPDTTHTLLVMHSLGHCATIQLHTRFVGQSSTSRSRCLTAANAIVRLTQILPVRQLPCINPIMAVLWTMTSEVLSGGLRSLRSMRSAWASSSALPGEDVLVSALVQVINASEFFANTSPYMNTRLSEIRQHRVNV
ncbi:unnamed protein product [Somion occarium]|uniref:Zn(2)-C6 fungal-type domain-containing protein n=1 Tax=Somion occarium TaxID=3059160 RepID=A0ABP1E3D2_9APHY